MPSNYVEDHAGIVSADHEERLNSLLKELEQKTGVQFIVLTIKTTGGIPIEQYSIEIVEQWKLGQAQQDNGFLLTVAFEDRKYRFEVGYGLEGFLTDQYTGRVGRDILVPAMRQGRTSEGIYQASMAVVNAIAKHYQVQLSGIPSGYQPSTRSRKVGCCSQLFLLFVFLLVFLVMGRGSFLWPLWLLLGTGYGASRNPYNPRQRGYWGHGGGFGGGFGGRGGFGGFGGGRGGGFGGGGASGGW